MRPRSSDRRQHVVYVTRHTEYHCRQRECVGVRDRNTGRWQRWHKALRSRLVGSTDGQGAMCDPPQVGERLVFMGDGSILTSRVIGRGRPAKEAVHFYASYGRAGTITA